MNKETMKEKAMSNEEALKMIGSYAYDLDIPIAIRMDTIINILKEVGIDYSYDESLYEEIL